jgi:HEAT repeat protein
MPLSAKLRSLAIIAFLLVYGIVTASAQSDLNKVRSDLASGNVELQRNALFQIRLLKTEEASRLAIPLLNDRNEMVRVTAASAVINLSKPEAARVILPLLNDKTEFVRQEAAFALGDVGDISATAPLLKIVQKNTDAVRNAAVVALGKIGDPGAIEPLLSILKKKPSEDNEFLRRSAARSIGQIVQIQKTGRRDVITPQNHLPAKYKETLAETGSFVPSSALNATLTGILQNAKEADDTRREAAFALGAIGGPTAISVLEGNRNSADTYLAEICKEALLKLGQAP